MKDFLKILCVVVICVVAGAYLHKCQSPPSAVPGRAECATDTVKVYDTIPYLLPKPQDELAIGTSRYTLPKYYFIGVGAGGEPRCSGANETTCLVDSIGLSFFYGTGAGGEPRCSRDSAIVELPIIQRHYADSTYEAWISGPIDPRLDSLQLFAPTTIITKQEWKPPKKWHIGPTIGYGYTPHGFEPYIGVSITYSILSF
ncbi:DUF6808 domain-containing protein [uncultured Duncaniella sp.]|uniref:DUF6808 domain-containing protein n=1 Tax=uncultured Duncaniella sp. TaxID=2768039 RepID=UPI0026F3C747|nr:hypothetical protein [uncultured Duncaniella sp.]